MTADDLTAGKPDPLQAFRLIDTTLESAALQGTAPGASARRGQLATLRRRVAGELLGAPELVDATLTADFVLVTHVRGHTAVLGRDAVLAAASGQGGAMTWVELADLAVDHGVIAGHGLLRTLGGSSLRTGPFALFIRFDGGLMSSEVLYMDAATQEVLPPDRAVPSRERLRELLDLRQVG